jgi:hypothetical protein
MAFLARGKKKPFFVHTVGTNKKSHSQLIKSISSTSFSLAFFFCLKKVTEKAQLQGGNRLSPIRKGMAEKTSKKHR